MWEKKKIFVIVKAYPEKSKKYGSSICMAGITEDNEWIRIYPIQFNYFVRELRDLGKFVWIEASVEKNVSEKLRRKESFKVKQKSIKIVDTSLAKASPEVWNERRKIVLPMLNSSMKELYDAWENDRTSLGLIKPKLQNLRFRKPIEEIIIERQKLFQTTLDKKKIYVADKIEHCISYEFKCHNPKCRGHDITCEDWELFESIRSWKYPNSRNKKKKLEEKYFEWMKERDLYFFMGMYSLMPSWLIIGLFYPPSN